MRRWVTVLTTRLTNVLVEVSCLAEADPCVQSAQRRGRPPVPPSEQLHQRGDEQGADDYGVDEDGGRGCRPEFLGDDDLRAEEGPESGERVLIDGNERAGQLQLAVATGAIAPEEIVCLITGDLNLLVVRIGKAVSSLWR